MIRRKKNFAKRDENSTTKNTNAEDEILVILNALQNPKLRIQKNVTHIRIPIGIFLLILNL